MKKYTLIAALLVLSVFNLVGAFAPAAGANGGGLKCSNLSGCTSGASCSGKGTHSQCTITCQDGAVIDCPEV